MSEQMGFFTQELYQYYLQRGKTVSDSVLNVLEKSPADLSDEEMYIYNKLIMPGKDSIRNALRYRLERRGANREEWEEHLRSGGRSIIAYIAAELLAEPEESESSEADDHAEQDEASIPIPKEPSMSENTEQGTALQDIVSRDTTSNPGEDGEEADKANGEKAHVRKSPAKITLNLLFWAFFTVVCILLVLLVLSLFNLGIRAFAVSSSSMSPTIDAGSLVFVRSSGEYRAGDVVTYIATNEEYITHRIEEVRIEEGSRVFITKGAANDDVDPYIVSQEDIEGKVALTIPYFGYAVAFLRTRIGFILIMTIFGLLIVSLIWEIIKEPSTSKEQEEQEPSGD